MLGLPPAFMLSLINKALDTAPSQWARSERRVSHAADHISSWRSCSKTKTNGRLRTLERCCCWFFWRAFFQVPTFVFSLEKTKRYMDFILDLHKMLWKNKYSKWWWIHLIYRRILWKKFKKSRLFFALVFFWGGGECFFNNFSSEKAEPRGSQAGRSPCRSNSIRIFTWTPLTWSTHLFSAINDSTLRRRRSTLGLLLAGWLYNLWCFTKSEGVILVLPWTSLAEKVNKKHVGSPIATMKIHTKKTLNDGITPWN